MTTSFQLEQQLAALRGSAPRRSPNVRTLAAYSQHTDCNLATLGFAAGVDSSLYPFPRTDPGHNRACVTPIYRGT